MAALQERMKLITALLAFVTFAGCSHPERTTERWPASLSQQFGVPEREPWYCTEGTEPTAKIWKARLEKDYSYWCYAKDEPK